MPDPQPNTPQPPRTSLALSLVVSVLCGAVIAIPFRDYEGSGPIWFILAPMLALVAAQQSIKRAVLFSAAFAMTWTLLCFSFLWNDTAPGVFALSIYTSLYYIAGLLVVRRVARDGPVIAVIGTGCVWLLLEIVRSIVPILAFPWLLLGHTLLYDPHLRQGADLFGVYGLSFIIAAFNACLVFALPILLPEKLRRLVPGFSDGAPMDHARRLSAWRALSMAVALIFGLWCYGELRTERIAPQLVAGPKIGVIQGNIVQKLGRSEDALWDQLRGHIELHKQLLKTAAVSDDGMPVLVCWAETMVPGAYNCEKWGTEFRDYVTRTGITTLFGSNFVPREDLDKTALDQRCYNTAYVIDGHGDELFRVYKRKLVPFGEYVPFAKTFPLLRYLRSVTEDQYEPGTDPSPVSDIGGYRVALNICVEDIHPDLARESSWMGADTLINITNDGWFYGTYGPKAHLRAAAWRAIEVRRPLLRVTNTGITVAVDPLGNMTTLIPPETVGTSTVRLMRIQNEKDTPFALPHTMYMRMGEVGVGLIFLSLLFGCLWVGSQNLPENF